MEWIKNYLVENGVSREVAVTKALDHAGNNGAHRHSHRRNSDVWCCLFGFIPILRCTFLDDQNDNYGATSVSK